MNGLIEPQPIPAERDTSGRTIVIAITVIVVIAGVAAFLLRTHPRPQAPPPLYASNLIFSDLKMSQAQNFAGGTVTYVDGTLKNLGDKTVTRAVARVTFRDAYGQVAQIENVPVRVLKTGSLYDDIADLSTEPLAPGHSLRVRLIFEHISEQWNQGYPELQIVDVTTK
jgi:hypothetical protein